MLLRAGVWALLLAGAWAQLEGLLTDAVLVTDATDPPAIRALSTKNFVMTTVIEYTREDLAALGVPPLLPNGQNRTLRPSGIALLEGIYSDTLYWTDAGAGAVIGMRMDASGMRLLASGLGVPEALLIDKSAALYQATNLKALYWGDSGTNRIQRCLLDTAGDSGAGTCTQITDVLQGVTHVAGLALDPLSSTLYWADGQLLRVYAAPLDVASGVAQLGNALQELVSYVPMPSGIAYEAASSHSQGLRRLYVLDQARPTGLLRVNLNGNASQMLVPYGLSRPRAIAIGSTFGFFCIADSGLRQLLLGTVASDAPPLRVAYHAEVFEPRGVAIRSDATVLVNLAVPPAPVFATRAPGQFFSQSAAATSARWRASGALAGSTGLALAAAVFVLRRHGRTT